MRRNPISMASLALALALPLVLAADAPQYPKPVQKELYGNDLRGKPAPAFTPGEWLTAEPDRAGKVVLIDFWATWCPPCRKAIPELNGLQAKFKDDLVVIGVGNEPAEKIKAFTATTKVQYALSTDEKETMNKSVGVKGIPHVLIISTDGVVRWQGFPFSSEEPLTADIVKQIIDADPGVAARHK
jgi:cytochrome c biogenesis protein CcmG/thiol:disulfide interchange protein DsbE